jgi:hypothetical protein
MKSNSEHPRQSYSPSLTSLALAAAVSLATIGCSSHLQLAKRDLSPVTAYRHVQTTNGLTVAIDPITNASEVVTLFGADLLSKDLIPVQVVATNEHPSMSYVISAEQFKLINGKYESKSGRKVEGASTGGAEAAGWTVAVLGLGPTLIAMPFIAASVDRSLIINQNLRHEQLLQHTLSLGGSTHGYIYFALPKDKKREPVWTLVFRPLALPSCQTNEVVFPYNW